MTDSPRRAQAPDRAQLQRAYADGKKFDQRRGLYAYQRQPVDLVGWALDHVQFPRNGHVLDVGCGPGYYLERLTRQPLTLVGLDLSEGMVGIARSRVAAAWDHLARSRALVAEAVGGRRLERPSSRFRLEDARGVLATKFEVVERDDLRGEVLLTEPGPIIGHVASGRDFYEPLLPDGATWEGVLAYVEAAVRDEIARTGDFRLGTHTGVFVCR